MVLYIDPTFAEPTSAPLKVSGIRIYINQEIYVTLTSPEFCSTDTFKVNPLVTNKMLAMLITAQSLN